MPLLLFPLSSRELGMPWEYMGRNCFLWEFISRCCSEMCRSTAFCVISGLVLQNTAEALKLHTRCSGIVSAGLLPIISHARNKQTKNIALSTSLNLSNTPVFHRIPPESTLLIRVSQHGCQPSPILSHDVSHTFPYPTHGRPMIGKACNVIGPVVPRLRHGPGQTR